MSPPGGRGSGRGGPGGGIDRPSFEAIRHLISAARQRPTLVTLALDDSLFTLVQSPGGRVVVPMDGDEVEVARREWPTRARVEWDDLQPRLERSFEDGGSIIDHFEVVGGTWLLLTRSIDVSRGRPLQMTFAYDRRGS